MANTEPTVGVYDPHGQQGQPTSPAGHPRPELTHDSEALDRVAEQAEYFAGVATDHSPGFDPTILLDSMPKGDREALEAQVLRNWAALDRYARENVGGGQPSMP